jgi:hypothetical protein
MEGPVVVVLLRLRRRCCTLLAILASKLGMAGPNVKVYCYSASVISISKVLVGELHTANFSGSVQGIAVRDKNYKL